MLSWLAVMPAFAQQTYFNRVNRGNETLFQYQWQDVSGQQQQLNFAVLYDVMQRGSTEFKGFNNRDLNQWINAQLKTKLAASNYSSGRREVTLIPQTDGYKLQTRGLTQAEFSQLEQWLQQEQDKLFKQYITERFYKSFGKDLVMPDHAAIAQRYQRALTPVAKAFHASLAQQSNTRAQIEYVMHWLQTIPYDLLQNRYTSSGAGFQTPLGLMATNKGDCDTKMTTMAALVRLLWPNTKMAFIYVPDHAMLALDVPAQAGDMLLTLEGRRYVLADATGPAQSPIGSIDSKTKNALARGNYQYSLF